MAVSLELYFNDPWVTNPSMQTDMATYKLLAENISKGAFPPDFNYQPLYYSLFLAPLNFIFGTSVLPVLILQSFLGAFTVYLSGLCASLLAGRRAGFFTAFFLLFSSVLILYTPYRLIATVQAFWMILLFYFSLKALKSGLLRYWSLAGAAMSFSILSRGNVWFIFPGILFAALYTGFFGHRAQKNKVFRKVLPVVLFIFFTLLFQIPFAAYNSVQTGKLSGPSTAAGQVLAMGNSPEAPPGGLESGFGPGSMVYPRTYHIWTENQHKMPVCRRILSWARQEPLAFAELTFRKLLLFWDSGEIPNNISMVYNGGKSRIFNITAFVPSSIIISLAIAGMIIYAGFLYRKAPFLMLFYFIASYWFSIAAFYILARFRAPVIPLLGIYAGAFASYCTGKIEAKEYRSIARKAIPALCFGIFICFMAYDIYRYNLEAPIMRFVRPDGVKVYVSENETMLLDNGPMTFGSWHFYPLETGIAIQKEFAGVIPSDYKSAVFELSLCGTAPGSAIIEVNGVRKKFICSKRGILEEKFPLPVPENLQFDIRVIYCDTKIFYMIDTQRDYGRTQVNGQNIPGELVCRLCLFKEDGKKAEGKGKNF